MLKFIIGLGKVFACIIALFIIAYFELWIIDKIKNRKSTKSLGG